MTPPRNAEVVEEWDAHLVAVLGYGPEDMMAIFEEAGLVSIVSVRVMRVRGARLVVAELDAASPRKATTLRRWLNHITVVDMTAGEFRRGDTHLRLNIRGMSPHGTSICVSAPFHQQTESAQVALIRASVEQQNPRGLVEALVALEQDQNLAGKTP